MEEKKLIYLVQFVSGNTVVSGFTSKTAPYPFSKGDLVDPSGWADNPGVKLYEITQVKHQLSTPENPPQIQHNVIVSLQSVEGARKDVTGNAG